MTDDPLELLKTAPAPEMDLDENAVLSGGRRRQRRRRLAQILASTLTVAAIALGGWWVVSPAGRDGSLPAGPTSTTTGTSSTGGPTSPGPGSIELVLPMPGGAVPSFNVLVWQDGAVVNLAVAMQDRDRSQEVGAVTTDAVGDRGAAIRFEAFARPAILLVTDRPPKDLSLIEAGRAEPTGSPWGWLAGRTTSGSIPRTTLWATLVDPGARADLTPGSISWSSALGTSAVAPITGPIPASNATASATKSGTADNVLRSGVEEDVRTTNTSDLPVAIERFRAEVSVDPNGSAAAMVTPRSGPDAGGVELQPGQAGAFVLPGVKDVPVETVHVYGLVRAGAGELTITAASGSTAPAHWSTSTFPVEDTDVVLVVVTIPVTSGADAQWKVSWQSSDGPHSAPVVVPGG